MSSTQQHLNERGEAACLSPGIAQTGQERCESQVGAGAVNAGSMLASDFANDADGAGNVEPQPPASAIQGETSAASHRCVGADIVICDAGIDGETALGHRGPGTHRA